MKIVSCMLLFLIQIYIVDNLVIGQILPTDIKFVRQGVRRLIFDPEQRIPLATLNPKEIIGRSTMYPTKHYTEAEANISIKNERLIIQSDKETTTGIWFGGFNPFATYIMDLHSCSGEGEFGFEFSDADKQDQFIIKINFKDDLLLGAKLIILKKSTAIANESIAIKVEDDQKIAGKLILQMLGSGLTMYIQDKGTPKVIGQSDFNSYLDLRKKLYINAFQSNLYVRLHHGQVSIKEVKSVLSTGIGLADIRAITYENGDPLLDQGRLWYTMSIRGRALPHHIQGVFSMNPTIFDIRLEGIIVFDRHDGLLRNEIASHIFYDRQNHLWRGLTTGFSAYANLQQEKKQLLTIESKLDPRFGFSIMNATPIGMVGDIEDPHILFDSIANKWRMLTCENQDGYKAIVLESDHWDQGYHQIAGPVKHNSTGTSIQKIGDQLYCFAGSSEREIFIYTYPYLKEVGTLQMDLPPWDATSRTRVWPNVVQLPDKYPFRYVALMMDRYNYPGLKGPNWSYGAIYLYHGYE